MPERPDLRTYLGRRVKVVVDRPLGSQHPRFPWRYPLNYGYIPGTVSGDNRPVDAYVLELEAAVTTVEGVVVGVVLRADDTEDKLVVAPSGRAYSADEIQERVHFQEQFFDSRVILR